MSNVVNGKVRATLRESAVVRRSPARVKPPSPISTRVPRNPKSFKWLEVGLQVRVMTYRRFIFVTGPCKSPYVQLFAVSKEVEGAAAV